MGRQADGGEEWRGEKQYGEEREEHGKSEKEKRNCEFRVSIWWRSNRRVSTEVCSTVRVHRRVRTCGSPMQKGKEVVHFLCYLNLTCLKSVFWD